MPYIQEQYQYRGRFTLLKIYGKQIHTNWNVSLINKNYYIELTDNFAEGQINVSCIQAY